MTTSQEDRTQTPVTSVVGATTTTNLDPVPTSQATTLAGPPQSSTSSSPSGSSGAQSSSTSNGGVTFGPSSPNGAIQLSTTMPPLSVAPVNPYQNSALYANHYQSIRQPY